MNITEATAVSALLSWLGEPDRDAVDDARASAATATLADRAGKALQLTIPGAAELIDLVADRLRVGPAVEDVLLDVGGWDEVDGDGTEASVLADHVRSLALHGPAVRTCRRCGCTDDRACDGGCSWATADLCSQCVPAGALVDEQRAVADAVGALLTAIAAEQPGFDWTAERTADAVDDLTKLVAVGGAVVTVEANRG